MDVYFLGLTGVRLRGKKTALIVDPFSKETTGVKFEKTEADAVLLTTKNSSFISLDQVTNYRVVIDGPGEYEVGGVAIVGIQAAANTTYYIKIDWISFLHLGSLAKPPTESELDKYPNIDVLFMPIIKDAAEIISKLDPKIVIPIAFDSPSLTSFLKEVGKEGIKPQPKLTITKEKLPAEMEVVVLGNSQGSST